MKTVREKYTSYGFLGIEIFSRREDEIISEIDESKTKE